MRLWSIHPKYLDAKGLIALWREALLAQAVLRGKTKGYKKHPQLERFKEHPNPLAAIGFYLKEVLKEGRKRGYNFDKAKIRILANRISRISVNRGQLRFEFGHLLGKLKKRDPVQYRNISGPAVISSHPLFKIINKKGKEFWEKGQYAYT